MIMGESVIRRYLGPLLELEQLESIRIGTKALAYWPQRFVTDPDADATLGLFEEVVRAGKNLAFMAHYSHPRELESPLVESAVRRILGSGATIRTQAPLIRSINDDPAVWSAMWRRQHAMGMIPYYMFVERDTGPQDYFAVPLARAYEIFREAYASVSGLCRTVRGPSMSSTPGKVCVDGVAEIDGQQVFVLHLIQSRDPALVGRPFFAAVRPVGGLADGPAAGVRRPFPVRGLHRGRPPAGLSGQARLPQPENLRPGPRQLFVDACSRAVWAPFACRGRHPLNNRNSLLLFPDLSSRSLPLRRYVTCPQSPCHAGF